jgi:hypothetical protein
MFRLTGNEKDRTSCLRHLGQCILYWEEVIGLTELRYSPMPYVSMGYPEQKWPEFTSFHWVDFLEEVERDLTYVKELPRPK